MVDRELNIRIAEDSDAPRIADLVRKAGFKDEGVDWSRVHPFWIVAEDENGVVGALQVLYGLPMGRLEWLSVDPAVDQHKRGRIIRELLLNGNATLSQGGASMAVGSVPFSLKSYKRVLKRRGAVVLQQGNVMGKRLWEPKPQ